MALNVFWDDGAKRIIRINFETSTNNWTWAELVAARHQGDALAAEVLHKVGMIIEEPCTIPSAILNTDFSHFNESLPNVIVIVIVANLPMARAIITLGMKASQHAASLIVMTRSLEEARAIVQQRLSQSYWITAVH
jgi:regulatory protein YycH of two-component signal transduction system YycFG